jgi:HPt (histidine-containing phosphotransfer) domain-containing protein
MSDSFADRMAAVRCRFAGQIDARINVIESAVLRGGEVGADLLAQAHRDAHHLCGVGATLGFVETGKVARSVEQLLLAVVRSGRQLGDDEIPRLREGIALLRAAASAEIGTVH